MNKVQKQQDEGFTIIEVVLVLAIGALIMLMVFIALPALQRNQRDNARKNDISRLQSAVNNYKSSARGQLPDLNTAFVENRMKINDDQFADPSGEDYTFQPINAGASAPAHSDSTASIIYYSRGGNCRDGQNPEYGPSGSTSRKVIFVKPLEGGGIHCAEA